MKPSKEIIKEVTDELQKVTDFDVQIYSDQLKYSEWFLAIATAGFSLCIVKYAPGLQICSSHKGRAFYKVPNLFSEIVSMQLMFFDGKISN